MECGFVILLILTGHDATPLFAHDNSTDTAVEQRTSNSSSVATDKSQPDDATSESSEVVSSSLFDGQTLDGWHNPYQWGDVQIVDGEIHLTSDRKFFLVTDETFHDFEFEGEIKLPPGKSNSGFMARGQVEPNRVYGYQAEADPTERRWSGGLYDESRRQWLNPLWREPAAQAAFDRERWNRYRIKCVGTHLQFFVNEVPTTDYFDPVDLSGRIGLQHHGEKGQTYRFRNLKVQRLGRHVWKPLFPQQDDAIISLDGWESIGGGSWSVEDGIIRGRANADADEPNGMLVSKQTYGDFTIRLQYRIARGDSGFFVRSRVMSQRPYIEGIQCEIDATKDVAGLYHTGGDGWIVRPLHYLNTFPPERHDVVRNSWRQAQAGIPLSRQKTSRKAPKRQPTHSNSKPSDDLNDAPWQTLVVTVFGQRIVTRLNGCLASDVTVETLPDEGVIGLQLHGGQDLAVDFRVVEILAPTH